MKMRRGLFLIFALGIGLGMCAEAWAQARGRGGAPMRISSVAGARAVRVVPASAVVLAENRFVAPGRGTFVSLDALTPLGFPVPGLGFDFAHLGAISRNVKVSDISVLSTSQKLALARQLTPVVPVAFPFFPASSVIVVQSPPPVIVLQQAEREEEPTRQWPAAVEPREKVAAPPAPEPREVGEFVLVRRDGRVVFAVAFTTQGQLLAYVTREGVRRSLPLAELDTESTRRMNEERGTTIHLPD